MTDMDQPTTVRQPSSEAATLQRRISIGTWNMDHWKRTVQQRRDAWTPPASTDERGYRRLYREHVLQANEGCDLDFLRGRSPIITDAVTYL